MGYIDFSELCENVLIHYDENIIDRYGDKGCKDHLMRFIKEYYPDKITENGDSILVSDELNSNDGFIEEFVSLMRKRKVSAFIAVIIRHSKNTRVSIEEKISPAAFP